MILLGRTFLILALTLLVAALWVDGYGLQLAGTAGILFITGASILGQRGGR